MEDQELIKAIEAYKKGEDIDENFNIIYHRSHSFVENKIRTYVSERKTASYDIEDITQDVYIQMSRNFNLEEPKAFWAWAAKIAKGKTEDYFDSRQGKTVLLENDNKESTEKDDKKPTLADIVDYKIANNPELMMDRDNTVAAVREILDSLTEAQREVIILTYQKGLKGQEAADALGINLNTLKSRQKSARDALYKKKSELRKRGVEIAVIPFVLLLHVACRTDEALAATLASEMAAAGVAKTLSSGTTSAAQSASTASSAATGSAGNVTSASAGASGIAKAAGTGIGVKAAAAVAAVAVVVGGGAMAYKSTRSTENAVQETTIASSEEMATTEAIVETSTEAAEELSIYASIYGPAAEDFAARHNMPIEEVVVHMGDIDGDGTLEAFMFDFDGTEALYITSGANAILVGESYGDIVYRTADGGAYVLLYSGDFEHDSSESDSIYFISGGTSNFVMYRDLDDDKAKQLVSDWSDSRDSDSHDLPFIWGGDFATLTESKLAEGLANNHWEKVVENP